MGSMEGLEFASKRASFLGLLLKEKPCVEGVKYITLHRNSDVNFLCDVYETLGKFSDDDWRKKWKFNFASEPGIDIGGLSREFYTILSRALFSEKNGLFMCLGEESTGLVHPAVKLRAPLKMDFYRFAGKMAGRTLYECAMRNDRYLITVQHPGLARFRILCDVTVVTSQFICFNIRG